MIGKSRKGKGSGKGSSFKWTVLGLLVLALLLGMSLFRETMRSRRVDKEIAELRAEAESLRAKNFEIATLSRSLGDDEFLEREARLKLGMRKEGEHVVVLSDAPADSSLSSSGLTGGPVGDEDWSNPRKWWAYFFDRGAYDAYRSTHGIE